MTLEKAKYLIAGIKASGQEREAIDTVINLINEIPKVQQFICDKYCSKPEEYFSKYKDPDDAWERMCIEVCENCPLSKMGD